MNRTPQEIIDWLLQHCDRDRVMYNALCNHQHSPDVHYVADKQAWTVTGTSFQTGRTYTAVVHTNPIGEPMSWHRL